MGVDMLLQSMATVEARSGSIMARLLLCNSIPSSVASVNRFSSCVGRRLLLCISITVYPASAFTLACQPNPVLVENAEAC